MSMSKGAILSGVDTSPSSEANVYQLSQFPANNLQQIVLSGAQSVWFDNQSNAKLLLECYYAGTSGKFQVVVGPFEPVKVVSPQPLDSCVVWNLTVKPTPPGYSLEGTIQVTDGYFSISAVADVVSIDKGYAGFSQPPPFYRTTGPVAIAINSNQYLFGAADAAPLTASLKTVKILDLFNLDPTNTARFLWYLAPTVAITGVAGGFLPINPAVPVVFFFSLLPGQSISFDVAPQPSMNLYVEAQNPSLTSTTLVQAIERGW